MSHPFHEAVRALLLSDTDTLDSGSLAALAGASFADPYFCVLHHPELELDLGTVYPRIAYISSSGPNDFDRRTRLLLVSIYDPSYDVCDALLERCTHLIAQPDKRFGAYTANVQSAKVRVGHASFDGSENFWSDSLNIWRITGAYNVKYTQK